MAFLSIVVALILGLTTHAVPAHSTVSADRWTQIGPPPLVVFDVVISPSQRSTLYAGTLHGVFKSLDGGTHWFASSAGLPGGGFYGSPVQVRSLSLNPVAPEFVLAGTEQGVFRSVDFGRTWVASGEGMLPMNSVSELRQDKVDPSLVYATSPPYAYRSTDGGRTWSNLRGLGRFLSALVIDPTDGHRIFGTNGAILITSNDAGETWSTLTRPPGEVLYSLTLDPRDRQTLFAGTTQGIFKSPDAGATWSYANTEVVAAKLAVDPSDSDVVYAITFWELLRTRDGGVSWTVVELPITTIAVGSPIGFGWSPALLFDPADSRTLFASGSQGLYRSSDHGVSWGVLDDGLSQFSVGALATIPSSQASLLVGYYGGGTGFSSPLLRADDRGTYWQRSDNGIPSNATVINVLATDPRMLNVVYAASGGIFRSMDGGSTWTTLERGIFCCESTLGQTGVILSFAIDPSRPTTLYAGTLGPWKYQGLSASGIFKSTDAGTTWVRSVTGLPTPQMPGVFSLVVDPSRSDTVYAGTEDGLFKSSDEGATWLRRGLAGFKVNVLRLAPENSAVLFAGLDQSGIQRSDDGGGTWRSLSVGLPDVSISDLQFDPWESRNLFAATFGAGISVSRDAGESWASFNEGLADLQMTRLAFDASGSYLFAGGWNLGVSVRQILANRQPVRGGTSRPSARVVGPRDTIEAAARQQ